MLARKDKNLVFPQLRELINDKHFKHEMLLYKGVFLTLIHRSISDIQILSLRLYVVNIQV